MNLPWKRRRTLSGPGSRRSDASQTPPPNPPADAASVSSFSMSRLASVITSNNYTCSLSADETTIAASWNRLPFRFRISEAGNWLGISTAWDPPEDLLLLEDARVTMTLQEASNEWNRQYLQPTGYPMHIDDEWKIVFHQSIFVDTGMTDEQIQTALFRSLDVHLQARDTIGSLIPPIY